MSQNNLLTSKEKSLKEYDKLINPKQNLGGYKNRDTGVKYSHQNLQTLDSRTIQKIDQCKNRRVQKYSSQTQTKNLKYMGTQSLRESSTQVARPGYYIDSSNDVVMIPGVYKTADEVYLEQLNSTLTIQRYARGMLGRRQAQVLRNLKAQMEKVFQQRDQFQAENLEEIRKTEVDRRIHPKKLGDFEVLLGDLKQWHRQETQKINASGLSAQEIQKARNFLLTKEVKLIHTVDRLRYMAQLENVTNKIDKNLEEVSNPKVQFLSDGKRVIVHTPDTIWAKELAWLYRQLSSQVFVIEERLDILLQVKHVAKRFDCDLTRELITLIEREADLLNRGRNFQVMVGLRKRISQLFLEYIMTPEFNTQAQILNANRDEADYSYANNMDIKVM